VNCRIERVAHARAVGNAWGMKNVGLPAPVGNWITVNEAAKRLGMTTGGVHTLVRRKQLKRYRFGRASAFLDADVERAASRPPTTGRPRSGSIKMAPKAVS
jgi:excisionase family DNA binding protein